MAISAEVLLAEQVSADKAVQVKAEFTSIGLTINLRAVEPKRSLSDFAWLLLAALPLQAFFSHLAEDFADDAHEQLRTFVNRLLRRQSSRNRAKPTLVLQDTASGVQIVLESDLPAESYRQLLNLDLNTAKPGPLYYDMHSKQWRSESDEERPALSYLDHPDH
jgi:hypothetical protein